MKIFLNNKYKIVGVEDNTFVANGNTEYVRYYFVDDGNFNTITSMDGAEIYQNTNIDYVTLGFRRADGNTIEPLIAQSDSEGTDYFYEYPITSSDGVLYRRGALEISAKFIHAVLKSDGYVSRGAWVSQRAYYQNDWVTYNNKNFRCKSDFAGSTTNPESDTTHWEEFTDTILFEQIVSTAVVSAHIEDNIGLEAQTYYAQYEQNNANAHALLQVQITRNHKNIGNLYSLTTTAKTDLVSAINEVEGDVENLKPRMTQAEGDIDDLEASIGGLEDDIDALQTKVGSATLQTINPDLSGAVNEVYNRTLMNATNIGNPYLLNTTDKSSLVNAVNETNTKASTNKTNIGTMLNLKTTHKGTMVEAVNEVHDLAESKSKSTGFNNIQVAVAILNAENQTTYKVGDNLFIRKTGVPDLWVYSVESTNVPYTYVSDAQFVNDLLDEEALQIGYYKVAYLETVEGVDTIAWNNIEVETSDWVSDASKTNYFYKAYVELGDFVDTDTVPTVAFNTTDAISGNFAPIAVAVSGGVFIWAKTIPSGTITIESIVTVKTLSRTVNNDSAIGTFDLVIKTQTDFDDLVNMLSTNTLPSTIHSIAFVGSGKRMPVSDFDEYYDFVHSGNGLVFPATVREIKGFANPIIYNSAFTGNDSIMAEFNHEFGTIYLQPQLWGTSIEGITLNINPASSLEVAMGFYKCVNIKNCSVLYNLEGTSHAVPSVIGFAGCYPVDNCCCWLNGGAITTSDVAMIGFNTCNNVTNCWCAITSNGASSTSMGFDGCEYISNCKVGGVTGHTTYCYNDIKYASNCGVGTFVTATAKWAGTNTHISSDTCDGYNS